VALYEWHSRRAVLEERQGAGDEGGSVVAGSEGSLGVPDIAPA